MLFHTVLRPMAALILALGLVVAGLTASLAQVEPVEPQIADRGAMTAVRSPGPMVAAAHPLAADAGARILAHGGSAVDAAIAVQLVLSLVEPQSSGIGGGGFLLTLDAASGQVRSYDGRETAPKLAASDAFMGPDGKPVSIGEAIQGGRSVGVPGIVRMMELAHRNHGRLPWAALFTPAIEIAEQGFVVTERLHAISRFMVRYLPRFPVAREYFLGPDGEPLAVGTIVRNPAYAARLKSIAAGGADAFYTGQSAARIVAAVRTSPVNPAPLTLEDLAQYQAKERPAVCAPYRQYRICSMGPPSSGATTMLAALAMLEGHDLRALGPQSPKAVSLIADALAIAFADRDQYLADSDFIDVPVAGLLDRQYLATRATYLNPDAAVQPLPAAGDPPRQPGLPHAADAGRYIPSTSHWAVVDAQGNVASLTASVQAPFGSFIMVDGYMLNNELTDFSFQPEVDGVPVANRMQGGKRPRSSMTPTLILDAQGRFVMAVGSAGGSRIISHVLKTVIAVLDWDMDMQAAINYPNFFRSARGLGMEDGPVTQALLEGLQALGQKVEVGNAISGLHGIRALRGADGVVTYEGGADPRREGIVRTVTGH